MSASDFFSAVREDRRDKEQIEQTKNWWTTGRSDISLADKQKALALDAQKEADKLKRYDTLQQQKEASALANRTLDAEEGKAYASMANTAALQRDKNWNALQVAAIRANGAGTGRRDYSTLTPKEEGELAQGLMKQDPGLPGKPGISYEDALAKVRAGHPGSGAVAPQYNADGTVNTMGMTTVDTSTAQQRQGLVPGHKNPALDEPLRILTGQLGIDTPKGEAPSALTPNQWQQYADSKSPGMKYVGTQPGMIGDQIARFKRSDGSTFFANTGAAKMQLGDALTPASVPAVPLDNSPGTAPRATMPDAANRSKMNTTGVPKTKDPSIMTRLGQDFKQAVSNFATALGSTRPDDITDRENAQPIKKFLGIPAEVVQPADGSDTAVPMQNIPLVTNVTRRAVQDTKQRMVDALTPKGYSQLQSIKKRQPEHKFEQDNGLPNGFLSWLKSWNKHKTSTNPLFPNYAQE